MGPVLVKTVYNCPDDPHWVPPKNAPMESGSRDSLMYVCFDVLWQSVPFGSTVKKAIIVANAHLQQSTLARAL